MNIAHDYPNLRAEAEKEAGINPGHYAYPYNIRVEYWLKGAHHVLEKFSALASTEDGKRELERLILGADESANEEFTGGKC